MIETRAPTRPLLFVILIVAGGGFALGLCLGLIWLNA